MALFCLFALLDKNDTYKNQTMDICARRKKLVYDHLIDLPMKKSDIYSACYYNEYDLLVWANLRYGMDFANYLKEERNPLEFLFDLAEKYHIILLNGEGFDGPKWSIRVSLANLKDEQYSKIGESINELFSKYHEQWQESINNR